MPALLGTAFLAISAFSWLVFDDHTDREVMALGPSCNGWTKARDDASSSLLDEA
jgi:hypothetical protein